MITEILTMCAWVAWSPASGDPTAHYFYEDDLFPVIVFNEQEEVCRVDWDVEHTYVVSGFNAQGEGPLSDSLTVVWPSEPVPEPHGALGFGVGALVVWLLYRRKLREP